MFMLFAFEDFTYVYMHICLYMCTCMVRYCWRLEDPVRAGGIHELPNMGFELQGS